MAAEIELEKEVKSLRDAVFRFPKVKDVSYNVVTDVFEVELEPQITIQMLAELSLRFAQLGYAKGELATGFWFSKMMFEQGKNCLECEHSYFEESVYVFFKKSDFGKSNTV